MRTYLELQCSVDDLVDFLELLMFINASLPKVASHLPKKLLHLFQ